MYHLGSRITSMFQKILIVFFSYIVLLEAVGKCPDANGEVYNTNGFNTSGVVCERVPGCNYENGSLTPVAKQCNNVFSDEECEALFPCEITNHFVDPGVPNCNQSHPGEPNANNYIFIPMTRAPQCTNPNLRDIALKCK